MNDITIILLLVVYASQWKPNVYLSILVHCLLNMLGTISLATVILGAGRSQSARISALRYQVRIPRKGKI